MPSQFKIIESEKELDKVISYCKQTGYASIDFETNAEPVTSPLFYPTVIGISFQTGGSYVLPLAHFDSKFKEGDKWLKLLQKIGREICENPDIIKVCQNLKFEYTIFKRYDIDMVGRLFDTMLGKYLLDEERPHGLKPMVANYIPEYAGYEDNYEGSKLPWAERPLIGLSEYCGLDCDLTLRLMLFLEKKLIKTNLYSLFRNMMMMGTRVLGDSEYYGMPVDEPYLDELIITYANKLEKLDEDLKNNKIVKKFQKWFRQQKVNKLIDSCNEEINKLDDIIFDLKVDLKKAKKKLKKGKIDERDVRKIETTINRKKKGISDREDKVDRYIAGEFQTKKELECLEPVNFSSPAQMIDLFFKSPKGFNFKVVKYTTDKKTKQETDRPSTDEEVLLELKPKDKSGFIENLLNYRGISKLNSTYIVGMKEKVVEGRVNGSFLLHGTVTGRLSSRGPNLQNIPRDTTASDIKPMFIPPPGYLLLQLDYSQAELRVMAAMAKEKTMIQWFKDGRDIHLSSALKKYDSDDRYDEIKALLDKEDGSEEYIKWKKRRKAAKTINFGIIYGQGANKLAGTLECSKQEAQGFLDDFFKTFPKIRKFINKQHYTAHEEGYVRNVFGRKRRLHKIDSYEKYEVAEAERQSVNAPIQGAASDYTLFSSILIWEQTIKGLLPLDQPQCYTVHDSLGYFVKPEVVHELVPKLEAICANPQTQEWFGFQIDDVVMKVDFEVSHQNWGKLKTYNPEFDYTSLF